MARGLLELVLPRFPLGRQHPLRPRSVPFVFVEAIGITVDAGTSVLLEGVLHDDLSIPQILAVHALEGRVGRLEGVVADEAKALGFARVLLPHDLWLFDQRSKGPKSVV